MATYEKMAAHASKLGYESTVGAGTPVVHTLNHIIASGDKVVKIQGALSGTLGYLMSGLQDGNPFSEVVKEAKSLGYTEPDPRDDLGGMDVARKALILSRLGWQAGDEGRVWRACTQRISRDWRYQNLWIPWKKSTLTTRR